ncbi:MAG: hypothetical protein KDB94_03835, partial [Acidobacteria bacterium]|nr:hypothetical protein [Acidobacteriota bacterium]
GADAAVVSALDDPGGAASGKLFVLAAGGHGEYRAYTATGLYGIGLGAARLEASRLSSDDGNGNTNSDRWVAVDAQVGLGVGYGRVLDVGTRMRVARIATALARSRSLGRPIDDATAAKLQRAWWGLRGELGAHRRLTTTVAILREAGVLLGEPDAEQRIAAARSRADATTRPLIDNERLFRGPVGR